MTDLFETRASDLDRDGFAIWRNLLPPSSLDRHLTAYRAFAAEMGPQAALDQPVAKRASSSEHRAHVNARTEQFHLTAPEAGSLWFHPELQRFAAWRFGTESVARVIGTHLFSLSNLQNDNLHTDYLSTAAPEPWEREFRVWCALEDIHPTSGPIHFYPGTHRSVAVPMRDELAARPEINSALVAAMQSMTQLQLIETLRPLQQSMGEQLRRRVNHLGISPVAPQLRKGDVILFNPGIAHGTTPPSDPERTRGAVIFFLGRIGQSLLLSPGVLRSAT